MTNYSKKEIAKENLEYTNEIRRHLKTIALWFGVMGIISIISFIMFFSFIWNDNYIGY